MNQPSGQTTEDHIPLIVGWGAFAVGLLLLAASGLIGGYAAIYAWPYIADDSQAMAPIAISALVNRAMIEILVLVPTGLLLTLGGGLMVGFILLWRRPPPSV